MSRAYLACILRVRMCRRRCTWLQYVIMSRDMSYYEPLPHIMTIVIVFLLRWKTRTPEDRNMEKLALAVTVLGLALLAAVRTGWRLLQQVAQRTSCQASLNGFAFISSSDSSLFFFSPSPSFPSAGWCEQDGVSWIRHFGKERWLQCVKWQRVWKMKEKGVIICNCGIAFTWLSIQTIVKEGKCTWLAEEITELGPSLFMIVWKRH